MALVLLRVCAFVYAVAASLTAIHIVRPSEDSERRALTALFAALIAHAVAVGGRTVQMAAFPMAGMHDALSLFSFLCAILAVGVSLRGGVPQVAWLTTPLVAAVVLIAAVVPPAPEVPEALRAPLLAVHIGLALTADAAFVIAGAVSVVYLMQEGRLKRRKRSRKRGNKEAPAASTALNTLPALEKLDHASVQLFKFGFPLMTLGIISGALYANHVWGKFWAWDPRNTISLLVWFLYAVMLHLRFMIGWRGRRAAILTVVGVVVILLAFVGLGLAGVGHHSNEYAS